MDKDEILTTINYQLLIDDTTVIVAMQGQAKTYLNLQLSMALAQACDRNTEMWPQNGELSDHKMVNVNQVVDKRKT